MNLAPDFVKVSARITEADGDMATILQIVEDALATARLEARNKALDEAARRIRTLPLRSDMLGEFFNMYGSMMLADDILALKHKEGAE